MEAVAWTPCPVPSRWRLLAMAAMMVVSSSLFWHLGDAEKHHCPLAMALKPDCTTCGTLAVCASSGTKHNLLASKISPMLSESLLSSWIWARLSPWRLRFDPLAPHPSERHVYPSCSRPENYQHDYRVAN